MKAELIITDITAENKAFHVYEYGARKDITIDFHVTVQGSGNFPKYFNKKGAIKKQLIISDIIKGELKIVAP